MISNLDLVKGDDLVYERFNVDDGLGDIDLDEWKPRGMLRLWSGQRIGALRAWWCRPRSGTTIEASQSQEVEAVGPLSAEGSADGLHNGRTQASQPDTKAAARKNLIPRWFRPRNKTIEEIRKHTDIYLEKPAVKKKIDICADRLVKSRRDRVTADSQRWERTCFSLWYQCSVSECPYAEHHFENRDEMRGHLLEKHSSKFQSGDVEGRAALKSALRDCKILIQ